MAAVTFAPLNAVELAGDATIRYQGITVTRGSNTVDDLVSGVTLTLIAPTDRPVSVTVSQSADDAKGSIIDFVGRYNKALGELNVLTQTRDEVVAELAYLGTDEQAAAKERLGMFQGDFTLTTVRNTLMSIVTDRYPVPGNGTVTMLANIGISTSADSSQSLTNRNLRGYLQIDEKKLDAALAAHMSEVKNLFGFDADGDLVIDSGVAFRMDQQLQAYTQRNGIFADRANTITNRITGSETRITRLESHLEDREAELRAQYSRMEAALNSLESQSNSMQNLGNQGRE
jgi:flagellar hook-associated protein 2